MQCPSCKTAVAVGAKFCDQCGQALPRACASCGHANAANAKFCAECGASLSAQATAKPTPGQERSTASPRQAPPPPSQAERRQLTIMFCDMVGSSALSTRLDPEEQRDVVGAFQATCAREIKRFDGLVAQYLGDGVLAYFGYPIAHEDDAERAVRAGLATLEEVKCVDAGPGIKLQARLGIASGLVVVGDLVREGILQEHAAIGETTNLAARLQGLAEPDTLVIDPETHRLVGRLFEYGELGTHNLKGFSSPVRVRQVLGASDIENRFEARDPQWSSPILGREEELEWLQRRWEQARGGRGRVVLLSGEPGIGKSRLTRALQDLVAEDEHADITCHCSPYHQGSALYPFIGYLVRASRIEGSDSEEQRLKKLGRLVEQSDPHVAGEVRVLAVLLATPGDYPYALPSMSPQEMREKTLTTLLAHIRQMADRQPVLMLVEDLHWVDPTSLELLSRLVEMAPKMRLLIVATARPEFSPPWPNHAHVLTLPLNRLDRENLDALIAGLTDGKPLPAELLNQIAAHTDGVPLFIEELTKTVLESGLVRDAGDHYVLDGPLPALAVPSTLQASLVARLDRLASVKDVAQSAAVIGRDFSYSLLAAVAGLEVTELEEALKQLADAGLIFRRGEPPDATYQFKHALVQDAAYGSLVRSSLHQKHARVAEVLSRERALRTDIARAIGTATPLEASPEIIAYHYLAAQQPELALTFQAEAAERAANLGQHEEAQKHFSDALAQLEKSQDWSTLRGDMLTGKARCLHFLGRRNEAIALLDGYESSLSFFRNAEVETKFYAIRGLVHSFLGLRTAARNDFEKALAAAQRTRATSLEAHVYRQIALEQYFAGDLQSSLLSCQKSQNLLTNGGEHDPKDEGNSYTMLAFVLRDLGRVDEARDAVERGAAIAYKIGNKQLQILAVLVDTHLDVIIGEYARAQATLEDTLSKEPSPFDDAILRIVLAVAHRYTQSREVALASLWDALHRARRYRSVQVQVWAMCELAEALISFGQIAEAESILEEAFDLAKRVEAKVWLANIRLLRGRASLASDDFASAEPEFLAALTTFEHASALLMVAWTNVDLFHLCKMKGDRDAAGNHLKKAHTIFWKAGVSNHVKTIEALATSASINFSR